MSLRYKILVLGASYGSLFAAKLALAGHSAHMVCLPEEASIINRQGAIVRLPLRGQPMPFELNTKNMPGTVTAGSPANATPGDYDLVVLAMQEPQYQSNDITELVARIGAAEKPCLSLMNMPPLPYLRRIETINPEPLRASYTDADVWDLLDPRLVSLCSPDAQAFRPSGEGPNVLQVGLPTNFKAARFESDTHTEILRCIERDIDSLRHDVNGTLCDVPVKLRVHSSKFVPLAKWAMLIAGNYRCILDDEVIPIHQAVQGDLKITAETYAWTTSLCVSLGSAPADLVPFGKYAAAANSLKRPSSAARALASGASRIERVDKLIQTLGLSVGMQSDHVDQIVTRVDHWLERNRSSDRAA